MQLNDYLIRMLQYYYPPCNYYNNSLPDATNWAYRYLKNHDDWFTRDEGFNDLIKFVYICIQCNPRVRCGSRYFQSFTIMVRYRGGLMGSSIKLSTLWLNAPLFALFSARCKQLWCLVTTLPWVRLIHLIRGAKICGFYYSFCQQFSRNHLQFSTKMNKPHAASFL